jgi:tetratricopeptide (TPR) repeat protein
MSCLVFGILAVTARFTLAQPPEDRDDRARQPTRQELDEREALKLYTKALLQKSEHRYLQAIHSLEDAQKLDPKSAAIQRALGGLHQLLDHQDESLRCYAKAVELDPVDGETWYHYAQVLRLKNKLTEATEALTRGAKAPSLSDRAAVRFTIFMEQGDIYEELKEPAKAADAFDQAWKILEKPDPLLLEAAIEPDQVLPRSSELLERIGRNAAAAKQDERAIAAFRQAEKVDPDSKPRLCLNLSDVYFARQDYQSALTAVNTYLQGRPAGIEAYERKVKILRKLNADIPAALAGDIAKDDNNLPLHLLYARELVAAGKQEEAESEYLSLAAKSPEPDVYRGLFAVFAKQPQGGDLLLDNLDRTLRKAAPKNEKDETPGDPLKAAQARAMMAALRDDAQAVKVVLEAAGPKIGTGELLPQTRLALALLADHTRQLDQAERLYRSCLDGAGIGFRRDEQEVYYGLLRVLWRQRKHQEIIDLCQQGLKQGRRVNRVLFYTDMARALGQLGKMDEALKQADKAVEFAGAREDVYARRLRAMFLADLQRYDEAITDCERLLKDYKERDDVREIRSTLSVIYSQAKNYPKAEEQLQILIETDPNDATAHNDLGYLWADQGKNLTEAEKLVRRALELDHRQRTTGKVLEDEDEDNAAYVDSLGWVLLRQGKLQSALAQLERAVKLPTGEDDPVVWDHLGDVYSRLDQKDKARTAYKKAVELYDAGRRRKTDDRYKEVKEKIKLLEAP